MLKSTLIIQVDVTGWTEADIENIVDTTQTQLLVIGQGAHVEADVVHNEETSVTR